MRSPNIMAMKKEFIKRWTLALMTCCKNPTREMKSVMEKKKMIQQTAAIAMAAVKGGSTAWSRAIIDQQSNLCIKSRSHSICKKRVIRRSNKLLRAARRVSKSSRSTKVAMKASSLAKSIVKKQTQVLKRLLPGGDAIDDQCCLIEEALDYIVSLKAQVDVMKELVHAAAENLSKP